MSDSTNKPLKPEVRERPRLDSPRDEDEHPHPTRPPTVADFIIDRDKTDPLRRFRF